MKHTITIVVEGEYTCDRVSKEGMLLSVCHKQHCIECATREFIAAFKREGVRLHSVLGLPHVVTQATLTVDNVFTDDLIAEQRVSGSCKLLESARKP